MLERSGTRLEPGFSGDGYDACFFSGIASTGLGFLGVKRLGHDPFFGSAIADTKPKALFVSIRMKDAFPLIGNS